MTIWRLDKEKHLPDVFSGYGSTLRAGRWHHRGHAVAYAAANRSLAVLEKLVHIQDPSLVRDIRFVFVALTLDARTHLERVDRGDLPDGWSGHPHMSWTRDYGTQWFREQRSVVLEVPSAVLPAASNYLINPQHAAFSELEPGEPESFAFDSRLFSSR